MSRLILLGAAILGAGAASFVCNGAMALEPSGTTVGLDPSAAASGTGGSRVLELDASVYTGDEIATDLRGQAQIIFVDDTRFVVGPNSRVLIDSFVFDPNKTATEVGINAVKGAFRFISGASPKDAYAIRTPTMTIGVRGTAFDLAVRPGGESTVAVHEGAVQLCDANDRCIEAPAGDVVVAAPGGGFQTLRGQARRQKLAVFFPYVISQVELQSLFQIGTSIILEDTFDPDNESGREKRAGDNPSGPPEPRGLPDAPRDPPDGRPPDGRPP